VTEQLVRDGNITNPSYTVVEQMAEFYDLQKHGTCTGCIDLAKSMIESISTGLIPPQYGYEYSINNSVITIVLPDTKNSSFILASQSYVTYFGRNLTAQVGPYATTFKIWLK
jgi:hypothetical protein